MPHLLDQAVSQQATARPESIAVVDGAATTSYGQLEDRSSRFANLLRERGIRAGDRVAMLLPRSAEALVVLLGVLKAGAIYVPLDPASPALRLADVLRRCGTAALLAHEHHQEHAGATLQLLESADRPRTWWIGSGFGEGRGHICARDLAATSAEPVAGRSPEDLAYIFFTSGSTGRPKGVPITHASAAHFVDWAVRHFGLLPEDRTSGHAPLHFDMSVWDAFSTFGAGAQLHLVPAEANQLPNSLAEFIRESALTRWLSVPSVLTAMVARNVVGQHDFPALRTIIWAGDALAPADLRHLMERLPHVGFTNVYGATEGAIASTVHDVADIAECAEPIPLGRAIDGEELLVLSATGRPAGVGEVGELCIGGVGLTPGYWDDPATTEQSFVQHPPSSGRRWYRTGDLARVDAGGVHHFHGRSDRQIKSRGYRIELDEIALALNEFEDLADSAVVSVHVGGFERNRICAAYVPKDGPPARPAELRKRLAESLPAYMLPARWKELEAMPRNQNGKIDHQALRDLFQEGGQR
ncbi:amino acid adenylation domain-containing protein [Saccharopolyspora sp. SCSIO 74807]|uniref:amino acid adenylation domain-containing protein n=1 Tax=Saccharopolyspora sp. SCSIO 74807 TaxID=3118084 RepID=UPI0030CE150E